MSDKIYVGPRASDLDVSSLATQYTKVILWRDEETAFQTGDDTGQSIELNLPWATQAMADNMLAAIKVQRFFPFSAAHALMDPAAELGDALTIGKSYVMLGKDKISFSADMASEPSAPFPDEWDDEFPVEDPVTRALKRKVALDTSYYGTRITRAKGLESVRLDADGNELAKAVFNADELAFYAGNEQALYFDPTTKRYMFRGDIYVTGNINLSGGTITWGGNKPASGISASQARTIITEELVAAPTIAGCKIYASNGEEGDPFAEMTGSYFGVFPDGNTNAIAQLGAISDGARLILGVGGGDDPDVETTVERFRIDKYNGGADMFYKTSWAGAKNMDIGFTFEDDGTIVATANQISFNVGDSTWYLDATGLHQ